MDEDIAIPLIVFTFLFSMTFLVVNYLKYRVQHQKGDTTEDNSLRMSELKEVMREAVYEANAPLLARLEMLEDQVRHRRKAPRLPSASSAPLLEELEEEDEQVPVTRRGA